jgi:GT2 family glycosyltransferase
MTASRVSVGITTRNRPDALRRCLESLRCIAHLAPETLVLDDASEPAAAQQLGDLASTVRIIRDERGGGYILGRNRLVREATSPFVLLLDDDAALLDQTAVERGLAVLNADPKVAAIAYPQANRQGAPWPPAMQPARSASPAVITAFIGFAHLVRRDVFLTLGGYRERFVFYGEEKDLCIRLLDAGHRTVFLPQAFVAHEPDTGERSSSRYLRYVTRNDCLNALYNEPFQRVVWLLPVRLMLYFVMRREWKVTDPFGWAWILRELVVNAAPVLRERRPVTRQTLRRWAALKRVPEIYVSPGIADSLIED